MNRHAATGARLISFRPLPEAIGAAVKAYRDRGDDGDERIFVLGLVDCPDYDRSW